MRILSDKINDHMAQVPDLPLGDRRTSILRRAWKDTNPCEVSLTVIREWKPRRHAFGIEITLEGYGARHTRHQNPGTSGQYAGDMPMAATWMDWGWLIAVLFRFDPHARIGQYEGRGDFLTTTAAHWPHRVKVDRSFGAGDFARTYAARLGHAGTLTGSPFELVDEVCPPIHLVDLANPTMVTAHLEAS